MYRLRPLTGFIFLSLPLAMHAGPVTFSGNIAPLVFEHCTPFHHTGGSAPFPLVTYADVSKHTGQIAAVTRSRYMPPWPPQRGYAEFANDRSLTDAQIALFTNLFSNWRCSANRFL
jgi:hypothetical protein